MWLSFSNHLAARFAVKQIWLYHKKQTCLYLVHSNNLIGICCCAWLICGNSVNICPFAVQFLMWCYIPIGIRVQDQLKNINQTDFTLLPILTNLLQINRLESNVCCYRKCTNQTLVEKGKKKKKLESWLFQM